MSKNTLESHNMHLVMKYVDDCEMRALSSETIRSAKSNLRTVARFIDEKGISFKDVILNSTIRLIYFPRIE